MQPNALHIYYTQVIATGQYSISLRRQLLYLTLGIYLGCANSQTPVFSCSWMHQVTVQVVGQSEGVFLIIMSEQEASASASACILILPLPQY